MLYLILILKFFFYQIIIIKTNILKFFSLQKEIKIRNLFSIFFKFTKIQPKFLKNNEFVFFLKNIKKRYFVDQVKFSNDKIILVDLLVGHFDYILNNLLIARELQSLTNKSVQCMIYQEDYRSRLIANQFGFNKFIVFKKEKFYISFFYFLKSILIFDKIDTEKKFSEFKFENIEIGKISLEHFFRFHKNINKKNENFFKILSLSNSFLFLNFLKNILTKNKIGYMVMGENQYLPHRMIFNFLLQNKIKIFKRFGSGYDGIKIRIYDKYSERYSHVQKYSKKMSNYFIKELSQDKILLKKLFLKQRISSDIGKEPTWAKKLNPRKTKINSSFFKNDTKHILILPHVMIDGMFSAKWSLYCTPYNWFIETLKIIKSLKKVNWIIKPHPSEQFYNTSLNTRDIFFRYIKQNDKHVKFIENNTDIKLLETKISSIITCHGSGGYEYPSIGIPSVTTADTRHAHFKISKSIKSLKEYKFILKNIHNLKNVSKTQKEKAKIYWFLRFGINVSFDVLPKIKVAGLMPKNYMKIMNSNLNNQKNLRGSFYDGFKYQFKHNNRHTVNHQILRDLKFKNFKIKNDI